MSPLPPGAEHGADPSPRCGTRRDAHAWTAGHGRGEKLLPASPAAGPNPAPSRRAAFLQCCQVTGGKQRVTAGRAHHGGLCPTRTTSPLPHPTLRGPRWVLASRMLPVAHPKRPAASGMGRGAVEADVPRGFAACTPASTEEPPLPPQDATESGLANASGGVCTRGEGLAGREASRQRPWE